MSEFLKDALLLVAIGAGLVALYWLCWFLRVIVWAIWVSA